MIIEIAALDRRGSVVIGSMDVSDERPVIIQASETTDVEDVYSWIQSLGNSIKLSTYGDDSPTTVAEIVRSSDLCLLFDVRSMTWSYANSMHSAPLEDRL